MDPGEIVEPKLDIFMWKIKGPRKLYSWCGVGGVDISYIKIPFYDAAAEKLSHGTKINLGTVQCPEYLLKIMSIQCRISMQCKDLVSW